ncbi:SGNH/GDSL hydrolase family protein [Candidatus Altiarchaeota archaeon]
MICLLLLLPFLLFLLVEISGRLVVEGMGWDRYYVNQPYLHEVLSFDPNVVQGVSGPSRFITNSQGLRSRELADDDDYRILAIGSSTTYSGSLDQDEAWTSLLGSRLTTSSGMKVWVGNAGKQGLTSRAMVIYADRLMPQVGGLNAIILMSGGTDQSFCMGAGGDPFLMRGGIDWDGLEYMVFHSSPGLFKPLRFRNLASAFFLMALKGRFVGNTIFINDSITKARRHYAGSVKVDDEPDMSSCLLRYRDNLNKIIDISRARSVRVVLVTQAHMYDPGLSGKDKQVMVSCGIKPTPPESRCYSFGVFNRTMAAFNKATLDVCRERGVECIDLEGVVPQTPRYFIDGGHPTEEGERLIAAHLSDYFLGHEPFG